jgi:Universal stress protein family
VHLVYVPNTRCRPLGEGDIDLLCQTMARTFPAATAQIAEGIHESQPRTILNPNTKTIGLYKGILQMYANILVSTDGSDFAKKGVEQRITLAKALNAKLAVITVTEPLPFDYGSGHRATGWNPSQQVTDGYDAACKERARKVLDEVKQWRGRSGYPQNSCMFRMNPLPLRLSTQQSPEAVT